MFRLILLPFYLFKGYFDSMTSFLNFQLAPVISHVSFLPFLHSKQTETNFGPLLRRCESFFTDGRWDWSVPYRLWLVAWHLQPPLSRCHIQSTSTDLWLSLLVCEIHAILININYIKSIDKWDNCGLHFSSLMQWV